MVTSKKTAVIITVGEIQTMSAGTGIFHSEVNASPVEPVEFLQIWIMPRERNTHPVYKDFSIKELERPNELAVIVSPDAVLPLHFYKTPGFLSERWKPERNSVITCTKVMAAYTFPD